MKHTSDDLKQMQSLPLDLKIDMTKRRIEDFYNHFDGQVYVSFSGGKDSTVLLHLVRNLYSDVEAVFVNTGLEYPEVVEFVKSTRNVTMIRPELTFKQTINQFGYPIGTKEIANKIDAFKKGQNWAIKYVKREATDKEGRPSRYNVSKRWLKLIDAPFNVSNKCCDVMKKRPIAKWEKENSKVPFIATLACESAIRQQRWQINGCNVFDAKRPKSKPMSFWRENDVLEYIKQNNLEIPEVYGEIISNGNKLEYIDGFHDELKTTGVDRTGCMFCGFGCHLEKSPNRFERMKITHPKLYDYCMKKNGLNLDEVLTYCDIKH